MKLDFSEDERTIIKELIEHNKFGKKLYRQAIIDLFAKDYPINKKLKGYERQVPEKRGIKRAKDRLDYALKKLKNRNYIAYKGKAIEFNDYAKETLKKRLNEVEEETIRKDEILKRKHLEEHKIWQEWTIPIATMVVLLGFISLPIFNYTTLQKYILSLFGGMISLGIILTYLYQKKKYEESVKVLKWKLKERVKLELLFQSSNMKIK